MAFNFVICVFIVDDYFYKFPRMLPRLTCLFLTICRMWCLDITHINLKKIVTKKVWSHYVLSVKITLISETSYFGTNLPFSLLQSFCVGFGHIQWAAVKIQNLLIRVPPHLALSLNLSVRRTYQGTWPAEHPPTILK